MSQRRFPKLIRRTLRALVWVLLWLVATGCALWAVGAFYYDFPWVGARSTAAILLALAFVAALVFMPGKWFKLGTVAAAFLAIVVWWSTLHPRNDRNWKPEVAQTGWAEVHDDEVVFHNLRKFDYRSETDFTPRWETRTVRLSQLTGLDLAINYWGSPWMAHPIASFQFADSPPVCFSIETRMEVGESYSPIGGFYRRYELTYIAADESDVMRVRTNFRKGEDIYLYRTTASKEQARSMFLDYVKALNAIHENPRWYNAITTNCTTSIRNQRTPAQRSRWDWRMLLNGQADEMLYERGALVTRGLPFAELKQQSLINTIARESNNADDFTSRIRRSMTIPAP